MDRCKQKTQRAIVNAYLALLQDKQDFDKITVQDIAKKAEISRSTFYAYYSDVFELSDEIAEEYARRAYEIVYHAHSSPARGGSYDEYRQMYITLLTHIKTAGTFSKMLLLNSSNSRLMDAVCNTLQELLFDYYQQRFPQMELDVLRYTAIFSVNGCFGLVRRWIADGYNYTVEEMARLSADAVRTCSNLFIHGTAEI